jgi:hypothetical protein
MNNALKDFNVTGLPDITRNPGYRTIKTLIYYDEYYEVDGIKCDISG